MNWTGFLHGLWQEWVKSCIKLILFTSADTAIAILSAVFFADTYFGIKVYFLFLGSPSAHFSDRISTVCYLHCFCSPPSSHWLRTSILSWHLVTWFVGAEKFASKVECDPDPFLGVPCVPTALWITVRSNHKTPGQLHGKWKTQLLCI